jgi:hypothetical protein
MPYTAGNKICSMGYRGWAFPGWNTDLERRGGPMKTDLELSTTTVQGCTIRAPELTPNSVSFGVQ